MPQLYVAQVKKEHGIIEKVNNYVGKEIVEVPQLSLDQGTAIEDAIRFFKKIE